jgi:hypothetical protein
MTLSTGTNLLKCLFTFPKLACFEIGPSQVHQHISVVVVEEFFQAILILKKTRQKFKVTLGDHKVNEIPRGPQDISIGRQTSKLTARTRFFHLICAKARISHDDDDDECAVLIAFYTL